MNHGRSGARRLRYQASVGRQPAGEDGRAALSGLAQPFSAYPARRSLSEIPRRAASAASRRDRDTLRAGTHDHLRLARDRLRTLGAITTAARRRGLPARHRARRPHRAGQPGRPPRLARLAAALTRPKRSLASARRGPSRVPCNTQPAAVPGQARGAYSIESNGQSRSSHARTAW